MEVNNQEAFLDYQEELEEETKQTFGFSLYQGQPHVMSFRDLLDDMLKEGVKMGALKILFEHCRRENKTHPNYFRVVINQWLKKGIKTKKEAEQALIDHRMAKFSTVICKQPKHDCLNNKCQFEAECSVYTVLNYFDQQVNPEVSAATVKDKKMIEARLNSIFSPTHLLQAIDNFAQSNYRKQGETRLSFLFNCDSYTKDWVNRVIEKKETPLESQDRSEETNLGENLSKEESIAYLETLIDSDEVEGDSNHE